MIKSIFEKEKGLPNCDVQPHLIKFEYDSDRIMTPVHIVDWEIELLNRESKPVYPTGKK